MVVGSVTESEHHNIRDERIPVDTIPLSARRTCQTPCGPSPTSRTGPGRSANGRRCRPDRPRSPREGIIVLSLNMPGRASRSRRPRHHRPAPGQGDGRLRVGPLRHQRPAGQTLLARSTFQASAYVTFARCSRTTVSLFVARPRTPTYRTGERPRCHPLTYLLGDAAPDATTFPVPSRKPPSGGRVHHCENRYERSRQGPNWSPRDALAGEGVGDYLLVVEG